MLLRACQRCQQPAATALRRQALPATQKVSSLHTSAVSAAVQIKMPSLSPTMEEGTIVKWLKVNPTFLEAVPLFDYGLSCH